MTTQRLSSGIAERPDLQLQLAIKRAVDIVGSALALVIFGPLMVVIAILVRLESSGPALFRQPRVGKHGMLFTCLKFRTMIDGADDRIHRLAIQRLAAGERLSDDPRAPYKMTEDPRITTFGSFLRRTSLDELPQLINVLRGEMSLVGPRPAISYELDNYESWHHQRHLVKPGITGLWQVNGRATMGFNEMMALDIKYVQTWNLLMDARILLTTLFVVLAKRGAR